MASAVHQFFVTHALQLRDGHIQAAAQVYSVPLVVALPGSEPSYIVVPDRAQLEEFFRLQRDGLRQAGIQDLRAEVLHTRATAQDRITATIEWYYVTQAGQRAGQTTARYFLESRRGALAIQMIEFEHIGFPQIVEWFRDVGEATLHPYGRLH